MGDKCCVFGHSSFLPKIVFGIHPEVLAKMGKPVVVISQKFCFCEDHWRVYRDKCLRIIMNVCGGHIEGLSHDSKLAEGLGCWVTITGPGGDNFQLPYDAFERIYREFSSIVQMAA